MSGNISKIRKALVKKDKLKRLQIQTNEVNGTCADITYSKEII